MAFSSLGTFASATHKTSASSFSFAPSAALNAGELGVLVIACDNLDATDGDFGVIAAVSDSAGNTWQKAAEFTNGQGGAAAGATVAIWYTVAAATLPTTGSITITFRAPLVAKAVVGHRFAKAPDTTVRTAAAAGRADDGVDPGPISLAGLASRQYLFMRGIASESSSTTALTATTGWTQIGQAVTTGGGSATNIAARGEYLIATATSVTSDPTLFIADHASALVALYEEAAPVFQGSASLSGAGVQSAAGLPVFIAQANQPGLGQLTGAGLYVAIAQAAASGLGHLAGSAIAVAQAQGQLAGTGDLGAAGTPIAQGSANLAGQGSLSLATGVAGAALLEGLGSLGASAQAIAVAEANLTGAGHLAASTLPVLVAGATLPGSGSLAASPLSAIVAGAVLAGQGSGSATAQAVAVAEASFTGAGALAASALPVAVAAAALAGQGNASALAVLILQAGGWLPGLGDAQATGSAAEAVGSLLVGQGSMQATGLQVLPASVTLVGEGGMLATALLIAIAAGMLGGHGRLLVIPFAEAYRRLDGVAKLREPALTARYSRAREGKAIYRAWR